MEAREGGSGETPWFAGQPGKFFAFRVNRRPLSDASLFTPEAPLDVFEHFVRMLAPGHEVVTGRRHQRIWRVGGVNADEEQRVLTGKLGWERVGLELVPEWSEEEKDWVSSEATPQGGRVVPFGFDAQSRVLAVLSDRASRPGTMGVVFETILRENEADLVEEQRSTDWSIEPILDAEDFESWLHSVDVVDSVSFTAKLPNPDPTEAQRDLTERMQARRATRVSETMTSEREEGLTGVEEDPDFKQAIAQTTRPSRRSWRWSSARARSRRASSRTCGGRLSCPRSSATWTRRPSSTPTS